MLKTYAKNGSSICEIVEREKEMHASVAVAPQTADVTATVSGECLSETEKALRSE